MRLNLDDNEVGRTAEPEPIRPLRRDLGAVALAAAGLPLVRIRKAHARSTAKPVVRRGFFSPHQMHTVEALAEQIIPQDEHSPGAREARVAQTIDQHLADLNLRNPEHLKRRALWRQGLARMDKDSKSRFANPFVALQSDEQYALVRSWFEASERDALRWAFFAELKTRAAWAYYTSQVGIHQDLGYLGNTYSADFEGDDLGPPLAQVFKQLKVEVP